MIRRRLLVALSCLLVAGPALGADAPGKDRRAEAPAKAAAVGAEILVLHATNATTGIDPRIGDMPELKRPPFSAYKSYRLLDKFTLPLVEGAPRTRALPNERVLKTTLLERLKDGRFRISASINQPGGSTFLPLLEVVAKRGQPFILAGQSYQGGILVLVIRVVDLPT